jgi:ABC-type lipoprotein release transport system permease subunit
MGFWRVLMRECRFRAGNALAGAAAVALTVAAWAGCLVLLRGSEARTAQALQASREQVQERLAVLQDEMRKATLKLSFNLIILPEGQDLRAWHAEGEIRGTLPGDYVRTLAESGAATIQHLLPVVQKRIWWEEKGRRIVLIGTRGELVHAGSNLKKALVQPVPAGTIVLGHELHRSLGLKAGDSVTLLGRLFQVHRCHEERGSVDDITAWIDLAQAQELLGLGDEVHAIMALECMCAGVPGADKFRAEIRRILPHTDVVELGANALARFEARGKLATEVEQAGQREQAAREALQRSRERMAAGLVPLALLAGMLAVAALALANVRTRGTELALLRVLGWREVQVLGLVLIRYGLAALPGGVAGCALGVMAGAALAAWLDPVALTGARPSLSGSEALGLVAAGVLSALLAAWLPALLAARRDPAPDLNPE